MASVVARARGLVKTYGSGNAANRVLDRADLDVARGELVAVIGKSGSGKSTLLHLLGGLDRADAGTIEVAGVRVHLEDEHGLTRLRRRHVGFVFQAFHLLPELTGYENVLLPARFAGDGRDAAPRAHELIRRLELEEAASRLPGSLSGGAQQRLAIVRAPVHGHGLARIRARRGRALLAAGGIVAVSAMLGAAVTVAGSLSEGFDRTAARAHLPDVIARFDAAPGSLAARRASALPDVRAVALRYSADNVDLRAPGHHVYDATAEGIRPGPRGYAIVAGKALSGATTGEAVVERG